MDIQHELYKYVYKLAIYVSMMVNLPWAICIYPPRIVAAKSMEVSGKSSEEMLYFHVFSRQPRYRRGPISSQPFGGFRGKEPDVASPPKPITSRALRADSAGGAREAEMPLGWSSFGKKINIQTIFLFDICVGYLTLHPISSYPLV